MHLYGTLFTSILCSGAENLLYGAIWENFDYIWCKFSIVIKKNDAGTTPFKLFETDLVSNISIKASKVTYLMHFFGWK